MKEGLHAPAGERVLHIESTLCTSFVRWPSVIRSRIAASLAKKKSHVEAFVLQMRSYPNLKRVSRTCQTHQPLCPRFDRAEPVVGGWQAASSFVAIRRVSEHDKRKEGVADKTEQDRDID